MAKFCGNCGTQMDDNAKVCGQCGTPVDSGTKTSAVKIIDPERKKKNKKIFTFAAALILVVIVAATAINVVTKFTGYNGLLRKVMAAYEVYDIDTLVSMSSDIYYYCEEDYVEDYCENSVGRTLDSFESSVGHSYKFSYEINELYKLSERKMSEVLDNIKSAYPEFDIGKIKDVTVAEITITASKGEETSSKNIQITMTEAGHFI